MNSLHALTTPKEVMDRIDLIFRDRPDLEKLIDGPRPTLEQRRKEPKLRVGWLAKQKLNRMVESARAVGVEIGPDGELLSFRV